MPEIVFKGKEYVYNHHLTVPYRPLVAQPGKGIGAGGADSNGGGDLNGNLVIHGDNLHALKSLLPRHAGQVDLIFIDPPYNTGNEGWCYSDGVNSPIMKEWLSTNPVDGDDMLRHDKWLCMMWPRLVLLRELLSDSGSIWITLDDNEVHRARMVLDEIFGEDAFVATMVWQKRYSRENRESIGDAHDYLLVYAKNADAFKKNRNLIEPTEKQLEVYKNPNNDAKGRWRGIPMTAQGFRKNQMYPITTPAGVTHIPPEGRCWSMVESEFEKQLEKGRVWFGNDQRSQPSIIRYESEIEGFVPWTWWPNDEVGHNDEAKKEMHQIFGRDGAFDTPKPTRLLDRIVQIATAPDALILDSFAGSGTTAHAVLKANAKDGGTRRFILVEGEAYADTLTAERVRRAINGYAWVGNQREVLLEEKITYTQFKKADAWLAKVEAIKAREGFAEGDLADQGSTKHKRFDKINVKLDDGVLRVEGEKRISERAEGLGGEFTYCTLGEPLDLAKLLSGEHLPTGDALGAWLFHTATGGSLPALPKDAPEWYLGEAKDAHVWLVYRPDLAFLKSPEAALNLSRAKAFQSWGREHDAPAVPKPHLVFAPAKYLSNRQLKDFGVNYAPLPFALYREG